MNCPQCGYETDTLNEGVCEECREQNQRELDDFNARQDEWDRLGEGEKDARIKQAMRQGEYPL